jgi:hypothetical protein
VEAMGMIHRGDIEDAMTIVALQMAYSKVRKNPKQ